MQLLPTLGVRDSERALFFFCPLTALLFDPVGDQWFSDPLFVEGGTLDRSHPVLIPVVLLLQIERLLSGALRGSVREVAVALGINYRTLHEARRGKRRVSLERVERVLQEYAAQRASLQERAQGPLPNLKIQEGRLYLDFSEEKT